jgi:hypothetical protein
MKTATSLIHLSIAVVILTSLVVEAPAQTQWRVFAGPNKEFFISFPGEPKYEAHASSLSDPQLDLYTVIFNKHLLNIGIKELTPAPQTKEQLASAFSGIIKSQLDWINKNGGRLFSQQKLADGGLQFDFTALVGDGVVSYNRDRIYIYGTKYYHLRCLALRPEGIDESIANQFLDSFRFAGAAAATKPTGSKVKLKVTKMNRTPAPKTN